MSFAIVKGCPTPAQLYIDSLLDAVVKESGRVEDRFSLAQLLLYCLKDRPDMVNTIEGSTSERILNKEILNKSIRTSRALQAMGIKKGDIVLINGTNHLHLAIPYYACQFLGVVTLHVDFNATVTELRQYLKHNAPKSIFADANRVAFINEALSDIGIAPQIISFGPEVVPGHKNFAEFICGFDGDFETFRPECIDKNDPVVLESTSGSTGAPKAAMLTSYGVLTTLYLWRIDYTADNKVSAPGLKFLLTSSSQWATYIFYTISCTVFGYTKIQSKQPYTADHVLELIKKYRPDSTLLGPKLAANLLQSSRYLPGDLASIRTLLLGGEYVRAHLQATIKEAIHPEGRVVVVFGCTEACGIYIMQSPGGPLESIGEEVNTFEYKIVDENDKQVCEGVTGELWIRGNGQACKGYYKDDESTKETFTADGWIKTGDLLYKDKNGRYFYVDRKKLLIKSGSYHIYPAEVEDVITGVPGVSAAAGVCWSERGLAALVAAPPGGAVTPRDVQDAVKAKLSYYKQLDGGVYLAPALPLTVSGKLDRRGLKNEIARLQTP